MKKILLFLSVGLTTALSVAADKPLPNQQATNQVVPIALAVPASGTVAATDAFTPRALLVNPTTGALKVESSSGSGASASQVQGTAADGSAVTGNPVLQGGTDGTNVQSITTDTSGNQIVVGNVASAATDSGNPVKIGGIFATTRPTLTNGQRGDVQLDNRGGVVVAGSAAAGATAVGYPVVMAGIDNSTSVRSLRMDGSGFLVNAGIVTQADAVTTAISMVTSSGIGGNFPALSAGNLYNGTSWDRQRSNVNTSLLTSAARTTTQTSADQTNYNGRALHVIWDITAHAGGAGATLSIQGKDANGIYYTLLTGTAETTTGTKVYKIGPGITTVANASASDFVPRTFRVVVTAGDSASITYSLAYNLIN